MKIRQILAMVLTMAMCISTPIVGFAAEKPHQEVTAMSSSKEYLISNRSWTASENLEIKMKYDNDNILIKQSTDGMVTLKEFHSVNSSAYSATVSQSKNLLEIEGSEQPIGESYYSRTELYVPASFSKTITAEVNIGEITTSNLTILGNLDFTVGSGIISLYHTKADNLKATSTTSAGELTINNSDISVDSTVDGRVNIYASIMKGSINAKNPTTITIKPTKLSGDVLINNAEGSVYLSIPTTANFLLDASLTEPYGSIYNTFPSGTFTKPDSVSLVGSNGKNPLHMITVNTKYEFHFSASNK